MLAVLWQLPILKILLRLKFFVDIPLNSIEYNIHYNFKLKKLSIDIILFYIFLYQKVLQILQKLKLSVLHQTLLVLIEANSQSIFIFGFE